MPKIGNDNVRNKGITIIALVVTFIILLIMAGVVTTVLTGEDGALKKTVKARDAFNADSVQDKVELELMESYDKRGNLDQAKLKNNLKEHLGVNPDEIEEDENGNWTFQVDDIDVTINPEGNTEADNKGENTLVTVYFAYYSEENDNQKQESREATIMAGDNRSSVQPPVIKDTKINIKGKEIYVKPKGWSKSIDGSTGIAAKNGEEIRLSRNDNEKTFYMVYTYTVKVGVTDEEGNINKKEYELDINVNGKILNPFDFFKNSQKPNEWKNDDTVTLEGWVKQNDKTEDGIIPVNPEDDIPENGDVYYPKYIKSITIEFNKNGGTGDIPDSINTKGTAIGNNIVYDKVTIPNQTLVRDGFEFLGYNENKTEKIATYNIGEQYEFKKSTTLYAIWKDSAKPTVEIEPNGKEEWKTEHTVTVTVKDNEDVRELTLKYLWNQDGETELQEEAFSEATEFTTKEPTQQEQGEAIVETIKTPEKSGKNWYLWVLAKDKAGNIQITKSNAFWIDNTAPEEISKIDITKTTTNSITVEAQATTDADSGVDKYLFNINTEPEEWKEVSAEGLEGNPTYTFTGLTAGQTYTIKVKAKDYVLNETKEKIIQNAQVKEMPQASGITLNVKKVSESGEESDWTDYGTTWINNKQVKVYATRPADVSEDEFIIQYKAGESEYVDYNDTGIIVDNNMEIKLRIKENISDSNAQYSSDENTIRIDHLDRAKPNAPDPTFEKTLNSITVNVPKVEDNGDEGYSGSGVDSYIFQLEDREPVEIKADNSKENYTHIFDGLTCGTDYKVKVSVKDIAGNIVISETTQSTEDIPDLSKDGLVTFEYDPNTWNNHNEAKVKINITEEINSSLKLQYKTTEESSSNWQDYEEEGFTITKNGLIYARLVEKEGTQTGKEVSDQYTFFDRKNPTITIQAEEPGIDTVKLNITESKDEPSSPDANDASGIVDDKKYTYYQEEINGTGEITVITTNDESYTYNGLIQGKQYKLRVEVQDKAGNKGEASTTVTMKEVPSLNEEGAVDIKYTPSTWTTEDVKATITSKYTNEGYQLQYKQNAGIWKDYTQEEINFTDNGSLSVRLKYNTTSGEPQYGKVKKEEVTWIDRVDPVLTINEIQDEDITTNSIAVSVEADDALSGLKDNTPIIYYIIEGEVTDLEEIKTQKGEPKQSTTDKNYTYVGLKQNTAYTIVVEAIDKAGNTTIQSKVVTTGKVPDLVYGTGINYTYNPAKWTNTPPITVTMQPQNNIDEGYTLQYATSASGSKENLTTGWTDYNKESGFKVNENCTIYARLKEKNGEQVGNSAEHEYNLIDIENPTVEVKISSYTTNSIIAEATASEKTPQSGLHDTERYQFSIYQGTTAEGSPKETKSATTENRTTFTGLTQNVEYTVKVVAKDNAGNTGEATATQKIEKVPGLQEGDITFVYDTTTWTNKESVNVTLDVKETVDLNTYKLQYQTTKEADTEWHDYTDAGFAITVNGTINARLIEKNGNQTGSTASGTYTYFDRTPPKLTKDDIKITDITSNSMKYSHAVTDDESGMHLTEPYRRTWYLGENSQGTNLAVSAWGTTTSGSTNGTGSSDLSKAFKQGATITLQVEAKDKAGNIAKEEKSFTLLTIPDLSTSGFSFSYSPVAGNWVKSDVTVKCTPDYLTDTYYKLQLSTDSKKTWEDYTNAGYTVSTNEKVYARLKERAGSQVGNSATGEVTWIDKSGPTISELQGSALKITDNTIAVTVKATDNGQSGINRYEYYLNDDSAPKVTHTKKDETDTYTYTGLSADTSYNIKIKVIDELENSSEITKSIKTNFQMEKDELKVGDYVVYEPSGGSSTYESTLANNGYASQTIPRETLNWRILKIGTGENGLANGAIKIISDPTSTSVIYKGANGYNNAVYDLNKMCETLYSHGTTKARSVNIEDFKDGSDGTKVNQTTGTYTITNSSYRYFPKIYEYESNGELGTSNQSIPYSGTYTTSTLKEDYWEGTCGTVLQAPDYYWIATRCRKNVNTSTPCGRCTLQCASSDVTNYSMFGTDNKDYEKNLKVRVVIELPANVQIVRGKNAESSEGADSIVWENSTLDKSIIYVDAMNERSKDYYGNLKSSTLNYPSGNVPYIYSGNNKELEYDSEGALVLDKDNPIPYYTVDSEYSLNKAYSVSATVQADLNQVGDVNYPATIVAISEKSDYFISWIGVYKGYLNVYSFASPSRPRT